VDLEAHELSMVLEETDLARARRSPQRYCGGRPRYAETFSLVILRPADSNSRSGVMLLMLARLLGDASSSPGGMKVTKTLQEVPAGTVSVFETFLEKHGGFIGAH
jgi:hypothetical protein